MCFSHECWSLAYRDGINVSLSVCIWVETCLGDWKLPVGLDLRKASMKRRKRWCLSPDGLRENAGYVQNGYYILHSKYFMILRYCKRVISNFSMLHYYYMTSLCWMFNSVSKTVFHLLNWDETDVVADFSCCVYCRVGTWFNPSVVD